MVNKLNGLFTKADEQSFQTFAVYCGLALHHAKVSTINISDILLFIITTEYYDVVFLM